MRTILLLFTTLLFATAQTSAAGEGDPDDRLAAKWRMLDTNGDGAVALAELHPLQAGAMRGHDADGDGQISLAEYAAYDLDPGNAAALPIPDDVTLLADLPYAATDDPRQRLDIFLPERPPGSEPVREREHARDESIGYTQVRFQQENCLWLDDWRDVVSIHGGSAPERISYQ